MLLEHRQAKGVSAKRARSSSVPSARRERSSRTRKRRRELRANWLIGMLLAVTSSDRLKKLGQTLQPNNQKILKELAFQRSNPRTGKSSPAARGDIRAAVGSPSRSPDTATPIQTAPQSAVPACFGAFHHLHDASPSFWSKSWKRTNSIARCRRGRLRHQWLGRRFRTD